MSHSRAFSNIFDNNRSCFFLDQNIVILSIVTRTRWASTSSTQGLRSKDHLEHHDQVNVLEHHDQVNVAKVVFQWLTVWGFCGSFLLLLPCTAKPSLSGPACSPTTQSKQATLIIVFCLYRVPSTDLVVLVLPSLVGLLAKSNGRRLLPQHYSLFPSFLWNLL